MAKRIKKFPKEIYVKPEQCDSTAGGYYLVSSETPEEMGITNDEQLVGVYQFVRTVKLVNKTEIVPSEAW